MSQKQKLLTRLVEKSTDFTWDEAVTLMKAHGFGLLKSKGGSSRKFFHAGSKVKVFIHKPHPENTLKAYAQDDLLEGLKNAGEID